MTREEALEKIKKSMECHDRKVCGLAETCEECPLYVDKDTEYEAHKVLIQALSQEPTEENLHREREQAYMQGYEDASKRFRQEPCDDAISRDAVLSLFDKSTFASWDLTLLEHRIKDLPPVTHKSGKWLEERDKEHGISKFTCSQCGNVISDIKDRITFYTFNRFCGKCGAKMESEDKKGLYIRIRDCLWNVDCNGDCDNCRCWDEPQKRSDKE